MLIIGLDAASHFKNFGYAVGNLRERSLGVTDVGVFGRNSESILRGLGKRLGTADRALIAIDAPLGWPEPMGRLLRTHVAGQPLVISKNDFFRRKTDEWVRKRIGKNPLEVGADRIARAAHHALEVLETLRELSQRKIPLAWNSRFSGIAAIEVYPAVTLIAHEVDAIGYKSEEMGLEVRRRIARRLKGELKGLQATEAIESEHSFDACLCLVAARDFLNDQAAKPIDCPAAKREGWIWVKDPDGSQVFASSPTNDLVR